ncbi:MAG: polyprenyl synthetase family protein [Methanomicrobiales archaeon]|nr:polyprenyl synthetase family protein [Methanomicrobiales archaeon]MDD1660151.1 polyprenyl synthetase family protein [Methanomicrobiales archaeon]
MELQDYLKNVVQDIDLMIIRYFGHPYGPLQEASAHLLSAGGKRLRPAVCLLSADAVKEGSSFDVAPAALALELIHTFTLIHDDIMDHDAERRGVPTVHTLWDESTAILAGDVLYARAFEFLCRTPAPDNARVRAVTLLADTCNDICEGQYLDMSYEVRDDVTEVEYLDMVRKKTGALYAASAAIGAIMAGGKPMQVDALFQFGMSAGIAFQIQDDLIDLMAPSSVSGKDRASDIRQGKQTLVSIKAREAGIDLTPYRKTLSDPEMDALIARLETAGVIAEVREAAENILEHGRSVLTILPGSDERRLLFELGEYFVTRGS